MGPRPLAGVFQNAPISRKLLVVIVVTTAAALLLAGAGILILDSVLFRAMLRNDLLGLAQIVGDNSTAALKFDDPAVAVDTLSALRARTHMVAACLDGLDGSTFAAYARAGASRNRTI